jgi:hypothetical protein
MAHTFLLFDFGADEDSAQQARHKLESWKQAFRLANKVTLKFERQESATGEESASSNSAAAGKETKAQSKSAASKSKGKGAKSPAAADAADASTDADSAAPAKIRLLIRLDFSDHEKLSHQRWLDRIPAEEPFKSAASKIIRQGEPDFASTSDLFDSLD